SLAESELGAFETWLAGEIRRLATSRDDEDEDEDEDEADAGDPLGLLAESLPSAVTKKLRKTKSVLAAFERDITELELGSRKIGELPAEIGEFTKLESLDLNDTGLVRLPAELCKLAALTSLDLSWNQELAALPDNIGQLQHLKELSLASCWKLKTLPVQIGRLANLSWLDLTHCESFESLPIELGQARKLSTVSLYGTQVTAENIAELQKLLPACKFNK
ncbi:MAG: hypothetical protein JWO36_2378, partial [Myxococcales bacterium]|nr:hypothetical protein [Myxococcales bacterium]